MLLRDKQSVLEAELNVIDWQLCKKQRLLSESEWRCSGAAVPWTHLGALYVVVQVVPEGVDEVDGVVSGIGIGVTRKQDCGGRRWGGG